MMESARKKVRMKLVGMDSNGDAILGAFAREAEEQGWTRAEAMTVVREACKGDYDHLLRTIASHVTEESK